MYKFVLCLALAMLEGCAAPLHLAGNAIVPSASRALQQPFTSGPTIKSATPIQAEQTQRIAIKGTHFGIKRPYNGDSCCIQFTMTNEKCGNTWQAGKTGELVKLNVTEWSDEKIIVSGFTGEYGRHCWVVNSGDPIIIQVWSAQTKAGPARWNGTVQ